MWSRRPGSSAPESWIIHNTDSGSDCGLCSLPPASCSTSWSSSVRVKEGWLSRRHLEVVQLQCMTEGFQVCPTGYPPERHVLLRGKHIQIKLDCYLNSHRTTWILPAESRQQCARATRRLTKHKIALKSSKAWRKQALIDIYRNVKTGMEKNRWHVNAPPSPQVVLSRRGEQSGGNREINGVNWLVQAHFSAVRVVKKQIELYLLGHGLFFGSVPNHHVHSPPPEPLRDSLEAALLALKQTESLTFWATALKKQQIQSHRRSSSAFPLRRSF